MGTSWRRQRSQSRGSSQQNPTPGSHAVYVTCWGSLTSWERGGDDDRYTTTRPLVTHPGARRVVRWRVESVHASPMYWNQRETDEPMGDLPVRYVYPSGSERKRWTAVGPRIARWELSRSLDDPLPAAECGSPGFGPARYMSKHVIDRLPILHGQHSHDCGVQQICWGGGGECGAESVRNPLPSWGFRELRRIDECPHFTV